MTPKSSPVKSNEYDTEVLSEQTCRAIRADAFDQFIEEQLQRDDFETESEFDVVCHVY